MGWTGVHTCVSEAPLTGSTALLQAQVITVETRMKIFCPGNSSILSWRAENIIHKWKLEQCHNFQAQHSLQIPIFNIKKLVVPFTSHLLFHRGCSNSSGLLDQLTRKSPVGLLHLLHLLGDVVNDNIAAHEFWKQLVSVWILAQTHKNSFGYRKTVDIWSTWDHHHHHHQQ